MLKRISVVFRETLMKLLPSIGFNPLSDNDLRTLPRTPASDSEGQVYAKEMLAMVAALSLASASSVAMATPNASESSKQPTELSDSQMDGVNAGAELVRYTREGPIVITDNISDEALKAKIAAPIKTFPAPVHIYP